MIDAQTTTASRTRVSTESVEADSSARSMKIFIAGAVAGAVSRTATAPLDRMKMLLQVDSTRQGLKMSHVLSKIVAEKHLSAFFKGNGANVAKIAPEMAVKLAVNDRLKSLVAEDPENMSLKQRLACGAISGAVAQGLFFPLEVVRTRLAVGRAGEYTGILQSISKIYREEGVSSFYRGSKPALIGILPYSAVDIALFETLKEFLINHFLFEDSGHSSRDQKDAKGVPPWALFLAGTSASCIAQFVSYPLVVVRTRLQANTELRTGMFDVLMGIVRREGLRGLYKGITANFLKLAPAAGLSWLVFEEVKLALGIDFRS